MRGYIAVLLLLAGCAGKSSTTTTSSTTQQGANQPTGSCAYAIGIETDASATDTCVASPPGQICEVSNGATVDADGGVENGTKTCTPQCDSGQYQLTCRSSRLTEGPSASPSDSLGCEIIRGPMPSNQAAYCCPCVK
ncbi:MAG TPA: hypothetical protein VF294_07620 [Polyangiaceae bacterium]